MAPFSPQPIQESTRMFSTAPGGSSSIHHNKFIWCLQTLVCKTIRTRTPYTCMMERTRRSSCWECFMEVILLLRKESNPLQTRCSSYLNQTILTFTQASRLLTKLLTNQVKHQLINLVRNSGGGGRALPYRP